MIIVQRVVSLLLITRPALDYRDLDGCFTGCGCELGFIFYDSLDSSIPMMCNSIIMILEILQFICCHHFFSYSHYRSYLYRLDHFLLSNS